jgi:hypothetical protein
MIAPESAHANHRNINCRLLALGFSAVGITTRGMIAQTSAPELRNIALLSQFAGPIERALPHFPNNFPKVIIAVVFIVAVILQRRREERRKKRREEKKEETRREEPMHSLRRAIPYPVT